MLLQELENNPLLSAVLLQKSYQSKVKSPLVSQNEQGVLKAQGK